MNFSTGRREWGKLFLMPICVCRMTGAEYRFGPKAFAWRNLRISLVRGFFSNRGLWGSRSVGLLESAWEGRPGHRDGRGKVNPDFVEKAILKTGLVEQCLVMGPKDEQWGQRVTAYLSPSGVDLMRIKELVREVVSGANYPKEWILADELPCRKWASP